MAGRRLTPAEQKEFFELMGDPKDIDADHICKLFARSRKTGKCRFSVEDEIVIGPAESPYVAEGSVTTVGIYIANKFIWEDLGIFGYINTAVSGGTQKNIDKYLARALADGDVTREQYGNYIDRCQYLYGGPMSLIINASVSETIFSLPPGAKKLREELLAKNAEGLAANDPQVAAHVEKEIVAKALEEMRATHGDDPALAMFDSQCGVDPYNNYKTLFVMKGAIEDNTGESPTGYKVVTSNYDTGVSKEDMAKIADTVVTSSYSSGVATQDSGANAKKYNALFQDIRILEHGSDCKTDQYFRVKISSRHLYRWVKDGSKLVMITNDNLSQYEGKVMDMRSPIRCKAKNSAYCSKCIGDRPYRIGIRNIGLGFMSVSGSTLNASLKKKHDISIKMQKISIEDVMKYVK
ncbi:MAG: hypothetical protein K2F99_02715 [Muribaculaceae bacterium]|nr:hypothetical protein [Muribaculaceae bacterium]